MLLKSTRSRARQRSGGFSLIEVLVALVVLGVGVAALIQLYSVGLRSTRKSSDYTIALCHARSYLEEAYSMPEAEEGRETFDLDGGFTVTRSVGLHSLDENVKYYSIYVSVHWPPKGRVELSGIRAFYEQSE